MALEFLAGLVLLHLADENGLRALAEDLRPDALLTVPVVLGHIALSGTQTSFIHDDDFSVEALALFFLLFEKG